MLAGFGWRSGCISGSRLFQGKQPFTLCIVVYDVQVLQQAWIDQGIRSLAPNVASVFNEISKPVHAQRCSGVQREAALSFSEADA